MNITRDMKPSVFENSYFLKAELIAFARKEKLQTTGSKSDLTKIIIHYLKSGERLRLQKEKHKDKDENLTLDSIITLPLTYSQKKRVFFKKHLGSRFSFFVPFQRWMKENAGKTYRDAIEAYPKILEEKKKGSAKIDKQFEYNIYIRAFFADNKGKSLQEAIKCWNYRKTQQGSHSYHKEDLQILEKKADIIKQH